MAAGKVQSHTGVTGHLMNRRADKLTEPLHERRYDEVPKKSALLHRNRVSGYHDVVEGPTARSVSDYSVEQSVAERLRS